MRKTAPWSYITLLPGALLPCLAVLARTEFPLPLTMVSILGATPPIPTPRIEMETGGRLLSLRKRKLERPSMDKFSLGFLAKAGE